METPQQQIERFHLIFLRFLGERIDRSHFVLKGGCNLRFYFKSIRYSEDIDFDVATVARDTLKVQVSKLLLSAPFQRALQVQGLQISDMNPAKQTDTTQRWKLKVRSLGSDLPLPTKIEFSRRKMDEAFLYEPVNSEVTSKYQLYPILGNHYILQSAFTQKVRALIDRTETQARDIFDINHLLDLGANPEAMPKDLLTSLDRAIENTISISLSDYKSQVAAYLMPEYQEYFGTAAKWTQIQERLLGVFEKTKDKRE